jgi:hypothetical protein
MRGLKTTTSIVFLLLLAIPGSGQCQKIDILITGQVYDSQNPLLKWLNEEPLVMVYSVPSRGSGHGGDEEARRFARLYFPRTYEQVADFDFIMLHSPVLYFFENRWITWMYNAIREGSSGLESPSCLSNFADIRDAWAASVLREAFPNDVPAVIEMGGPRGPVDFFRIVVNENFPEPVLTSFVPLGIESYPGHLGYFIAPREGSETLAWQVGNWPGENVPYMVTWDYEQGRTMTLADSFGLQFWSSYYQGASHNPYGLDILMNMVLYLTRREVPTDVFVLHRMRVGFGEFRTKMGLMLSLIEFLERLGASDRRLRRIGTDPRLRSGGVRRCRKAGKGNEGPGAGVGLCD